MALEGFKAFWAVYPRRVGKLAAVKAYQKALTLATHEEIMAGVERYIKTKPAYADWCHPKTFLSQGRWMDEVDVSPRAECSHVPPCPDRWSHSQLLEVERVGDRDLTAGLRRVIQKRAEQRVS